VKPDEEAFVCAKALAQKLKEAPGPALDLTRWPDPGGAPTRSRDRRGRVTSSVDAVLLEEAAGDHDLLDLARALADEHQWGVAV